MEATMNAGHKEKATEVGNDAHLVAICKLTATDVVTLAISLGVSPARLLAGGLKD